MNTILSFLLLAAMPLHAVAVNVDGQEQYSLSDLENQATVSSDGFVSENPMPTVSQPLVALPPPTATQPADEEDDESIFDQAIGHALVAGGILGGIWAGIEVGIRAKNSDLHRRYQLRRQRNNLEKMINETDLKDPKIPEELKRIIRDAEKKLKDNESSYDRSNFNKRGFKTKKAYYKELKDIVGNTATQLAQWRDDPETKYVNSSSTDNAMRHTAALDTYRKRLKTISGYAKTPSSRSQAAAPLSTRSSLGSPRQDWRNPRRNSLSSQDSRSPRETPRDLKHQRTLDEAEILHAQHIDELETLKDRHRAERDRQQSKLDRQRADRTRNRERSPSHPNRRGSFG